MEFLKCPNFFQIKVFEMPIFKFETFPKTYFFTQNEVANCVVWEEVLVLIILVCGCREELGLAGVFLWNEDRFDDRWSTSSLQDMSHWMAVQPDSTVPRIMIGRLKNMLTVNLLLKELTLLQTVNHCPGHCRMNEEVNTVESQFYVWPLSAQKTCKIEFLRKVESQSL